MPKVTRRRYLLGTVYRSDEGKILVKASSIPNLGDKVLDNKLREIGYVSNVLGPASSPFVVVKLIKEIELPEGTELYGRR
ncbi:MAG TPA: hypothetical protein EYH45_03335 [Candidatus Caldiarchaeum subterraneum]|uniref:H/ACA RNA-protein complex protein Gar1 n=1 Tax=Caldiarchaeum subterraneum TaxID=311458 RepID=A0A832ZVF7_CALS0|nr:hypothetical protein [Aigarchaeota archaeon]HIQ29577.1 hypothetical protein [Candidatus Caldarchaeum subterraneum]